MRTAQETVLIAQALHNVGASPLRTGDDAHLANAGAGGSLTVHDYEGVGNISKRTVQLDLQMMRSDRYGYNAPIEVYEQKYYRYADPDYSITNLPLSQRDYEMMQEAVGMLRQFQDFDFFTEMSDVVNRMQDQLACRISIVFVIGIASTSQGDAIL